MEGPHDESKALGISRDGETAVGSTLVVDFQRAWRCDIDWAIATDDGVPPLYNELKVQEDIGIIAPSRPSGAYAASDMTSDPTGYDLSALQLDWGGSMPVGTYTLGTVSYALEWLLPVLDSIDEGDYVAIPDFGGGISEMVAKDVSADGLVMVGYGNNKKGPLAFRADMTDPLLPVVKPLTITDSAYTAQTLQVDEGGGGLAGRHDPRRLRRHQDRQPRLDHPGSRRQHRSDHAAERGPAQHPRRQVRRGLRPGPGP